MLLRNWKEKIVYYVMRAGLAGTKKNIYQLPTTKYQLSNRKPKVVHVMRKITLLYIH